MAVILQVSAGAATNRDEELNDIYRKTQQYVNRFNTMNNPEKEHQEVVDELDNLQEYVWKILFNSIVCGAAIKRMFWCIFRHSLTFHYFIVVTSLYMKCTTNIPYRDR